MTERVGLAESINALRAELTQASVASTNQDLRFRVDTVNVELEVTTERVTQGEAGLKFWVVEVGGQHERSTSRTHRVTVSLTPQTPSGSVYTGDERIPE